MATKGKAKEMKEAKLSFEPDVKPDENDLKEIAKEDKELGVKSKFDGKKWHVTGPKKKLVALAKEYDLKDGEYELDESVNESLESESLFIEKKKNNKSVKDKKKAKLVKDASKNAKPKAVKPEAEKMQAIVAYDKDGEALKSFAIEDEGKANEFVRTNKDAMTLVKCDGKSRKPEVIWSREKSVSDLETANELRKDAKKARKSMKESRGAESEELWAEVQMKSAERLKNGEYGFSSDITPTVVRRVCKKLGCEYCGHELLGKWYKNKYFHHFRKDKIEENHSMRKKENANAIKESKKLKEYNLAKGAKPYKVCGDKEYYVAEYDDVDRKMSGNGSTHTVVTKKRGEDFGLGSGSGLGFKSEKEAKKWIDDVCSVKESFGDGLERIADGTDEYKRFFVIDHGKHITDRFGDRIEVPGYDAFKNIVDAKKAIDGLGKVEYCVMDEDGNNVDCFEERIKAVRFCDEEGLDRVLQVVYDNDENELGLAIVHQRETESMKESKEIKEEFYRGCEGVEFVWNGEWSDPELEYEGKKFNYWDIEDALWSMFLEDTGHEDSDAEDPEVEEEFNLYVQEHCKDYLNDVIAGGYFGESVKESVDEKELLDAVEYSYGMDEEEAKALIASLDDKSKEEIVRGWKQDAKAGFEESLKGEDEEFPYLSACREFDLLKSKLGKDILKDVEAEIKDFQDNYMGAEDVSAYEEKHSIGEKGFPDAVLWYEGLITTEEFIDYARDAYGSGEGVEEALKIVTGLEDYKPWGGAIKHWEELEKEGYAGAFESYIEDMFPEGIPVTQLNDILWFEWDEVREALGMDTEDDEIEVETEIEEESLKEDAPYMQETEIWDKLQNAYKDSKVWFDITSDNFLLVEDWDSVIEIEKILQPGFEPRDKYDTSVLDEAGIEWGFTDEWEKCNHCGKKIRISPDSYSWKADFFVDYDAGEFVCGDDVRKEPANYIIWLLEDPANRANTILSDSDLEREGFEKVSDEYEAGWYERNDDPKKILDKALEENPDGEYIFSITKKGQFSTRFELWVRRSEEYEESLKESKDIRPNAKQKKLGREGGWGEFEVEHGYGVFQDGWNHAPLDIICRIDEMDVFEGDLEAVEQAKKDGYKFIDLDAYEGTFDDDAFYAFPEQILDTEENRKNLEKYYMRDDEDEDEEEYEDEVHLATSDLEPGQWLE